MTVTPACYIARTLVVAVVATQLEVSVENVRKQLSRQVFADLDVANGAHAGGVVTVAPVMVIEQCEQVAAGRSRRGGARVGAGRKKSGRRVGPPHRQRPELSSRHPVHVTMRMDRRRMELRTHKVYRQVRRVLGHFLGRDDFRVVHISIQNQHLHLLVEAADRRALSRAMKSLAIRLQRAINGPFGTLFTQRYHAVQIRTARQARCALAYVLNNWRRHRLDIDHRGRIATAKLDEFSSALAFTGWTIRFGVPTGYEVLPVSAPRTWLLRDGWREFGRIDPLETPGPLQWR